MQTITMPKAGKNTSGTVKQWLVSPGAGYAKGDVLAIIELEDSIAEVTADSAGTLVKVIAAEKQTIAIGDAIAEVDGEGAAAPAAPAAKPAAEIKGNPDAATPILMPQVGNDMEEGTIVKWNVAVGDAVAKGQIIFEVETDKATIEIEADHDGRLAKIIVGEDGEAPIKTPVAVLADNDDDAEAWVAVNMAAEESAPAAPAVEIELPENVTPILMPQVGNDMEEGTIVKWNIAEGDTIETGQIIFEVETDKATIEIEADQAGRVAKIVVGEGGEALIKTPVALICDNDDDAAKYAAGLEAQAKAAAAAPAPAVKKEAPKPAAPAPKKAAPKAAPVKTPVSAAGGRVKASPAARRIAAERGVDLASISAGSGPRGRIISTDVLTAPVAAPAAFGKPLPAAAPVVTGPMAEVTRSVLKGMRKAIATNLTKSKQTIPHFYLQLTIDADPMLAFYKSQKTLYKCSVNDVILMALGRTMHEFPAFCCRLEGEEVVQLPSANIGIAVGIENGLVVPVLQDVDRMSLPEIAAGSREIVLTARDGGKVPNMGTGSFTVSNMGMFGVESFSAIVNPPESGIIAIGAARESVIVENGMMKIGKAMTMTISCDHRIVDGMLAAQFAARLKELLENPQVMM